MKKFITSLMVAAALVGGTAISAGASRPLKSCDGYACAIAAQPFQIPGPEVEGDGRIGTNGNPFYRIHTVTTLYVDNSSSGDSQTVTCFSSPCYATAITTKRFGTHVYQTRVSGWYEVVVGGIQWPLFDESTTWTGTRGPDRKTPEAVDSATNCANDGPFFVPPRGDGCIKVVGSGLHVDTVQAGVTDVPINNSSCGYYKVGVIPPGGTISVIHTSAQSCIGDNQTYWGPTYTQNKNYASGTKICGWRTEWYQQKGCATIS